MECLRSCSDYQINCLSANMAHLIEVETLFSKGAVLDI